MTTAPRLTAFTDYPLPDSPSVAEVELLTYDRNKVVGIRRNGFYCEVHAGDLFCDAALTIPIGDATLSGLPYAESAPYPTSRSLMTELKARPRPR